MTVTQTTEEVFVATALKSWDLWVGRTGKIFDSLTDDDMLTPIAPGKNRPIYLLGHLITVNDGMIPQLRLGEPDFEALREPFLVKPDSAESQFPPLPQLRQNWKDLNLRLSSLFAELTPAQWIERHLTVSEEDFAKEPYRNRLAILHSRTSHTAYHLGQLMMVAKPRRTTETG
jgi:hypothetical protein